MKYLCYITLEKRGGEKILVSPKFTEESDAFIFLNELLEDMRFFLQFYSSQNKYSYFNDDFVLAIEPEEHCTDLVIETNLTSGPKLFEMCFDKAITFIEQKNIAN